MNSAYKARIKHAKKNTSKGKQLAARTRAIQNEELGLRKIQY